MNLDSIIAATNSGRAGIADENHDKGGINVDVDAAIRSRAGVAAWDAYEMGVSAESVTQALAAADGDPEAIEAIRQTLVEAANRRANLHTRADGTIAAMVSGEPAWHKLGYTMQADFTAEQIKQLCLNWTYQICQALDQRSEPIPGLRYVELIESTGERRALSGVGVGGKFNLVQPADFIDWSAKLVDSIDGARFIAAGAVDEGKRIWVQAKLPEVLEPIRGDVTEHLILMTDCFDSTGSQKCVTTADRAVCQNTLRLASSNGSTAFKNRHTINMSTRMADYEREIATYRTAWREFSDAAPAMVSTSVGVRDFAKPILDDVIGVTEATADVAKALQLSLAETEIDQKRKLLEKRIVKSDSALDVILDIAESDTNTARGSVWGAFQSTTEYANHALKYSGRSKDKGAFESVLMGGRGDQINQRALESALSLTA